MKKLSVTILAALTLFACKQEKTFTITGTVAQTELEGKEIKLRQNIDGTWTVTDSVIIVDGQYTFTGAVERPTQTALWAIDPETNRPVLSVSLILENARIKVTSDEEGVSKVTGTRNNDLFQALAEAQRPIQQKINELMTEARAAHQAGNTELVNSFGEKITEYNNEILKIRVEFVKNNINSFAGQSQLGSIANSLPLEDVKEILALANNTALRVPEVKRVVERVEALERTAVGQPFVDLRMPDPNGNMIALSDFVGKGYVMIDFTATWCGPCRVGKPAMIATYNKYKDRGFNIVGVWFDSSHEAWISGMKALNLPDWPQMSDLKGWQSEGQLQYVTSGIPHSVLIDPNGIIIARGLRGQDLDDKLAELLK